MHKITDITPMNIILNVNASKICEAVRLSEGLTHQQLSMPTEGSQFWFPRSNSNSVTNVPTTNPIYTNRN